jgi:flagellar hook-associated protein 3 FlgL
LLSIANQTDGSGGYLFSGQASTKMPFVDKPGGVAIQDGIVSGEVTASTEEHLPLSIDGPSIWLQANSGNGSFETGVTPLANKANGVANSGSAYISAGTVGNPGNLTGQNYELRFSGSGASATYSVYTFDMDASGNRSNYAAAVDGNNVPLTGRPYTAGKTISDIPGATFSIQGSPADGDSFDVLPAQPDLSVFDALDRAVTVLEGTATDGATATQAVNSGLRDLDQVLSRFSAARSQVGETRNQLDALTSRTGDRVLAAKTTRSQAEDLDMAAAASDFTTKQSSYQAALQSYTMVQKLSLFNYINN